MKLFGDVPEEHRELARQLDEMEEYFDGAAKRGNLPMEKIAQGYVCGAHDYYQIDCEEEGNRLLEKAEKVCPGYFKTFMVQHTKEDKDFDTLVKQLTSELAYLLLRRLKDGSGN